MKGLNLTTEKPIPKDTPVLHSGGESQRLQRQAAAEQKRLILILGVSILFALMFEFLGRGLFRLFNVSHGVTGSLTLVALFIWGMASVYVIRHLRSAPYIVFMVTLGAFGIVFSQVISVSIFYNFLYVGTLAIKWPILDFLLEEGAFLLGIFALFTGFYASIFETRRSNIQTEVERQLLAREVEERKRIQEDLERSEQTLSMLVSFNPESLLLVDEGRRVIVANKAAAVRLNSSVAELMGKDLLDYYPPECANITKAGFEKAAASGLPCRFEEQRRENYYESYICPIKDADGCIQRYAVMDIDITEYRRMAEELRSLNHDLEAKIQQRIQELRTTHDLLGDMTNLNQELITVSPLGILVFKTTGHCLEANKAALHFLECNETELPGNNLRLVDILRRMGLSDLSREVVEGSASAAGEVHAVTPSGRHAWFEYYTSFFTSANEEHLLLIVNDVSDRVAAKLAMEEQRQKMENAEHIVALGMMAGDIAHELKTPLAVLSLCSEQMQTFYKSDFSDRIGIEEVLDVLGRNVTKMTNIVKTLNNISRKGTDDPFEAVSIKCILDNVIELVRNRFRKSNISLQISEVPDTILECRSCQVSQVLVNLLNNAHDAVAPLQEKWVRVDVSEKASHIVCSIMDSGETPPPEIRRRIFTPFYTGKPPGKGVGLGLSISWRIIDAHNGRLVLEENLSNTCFTFELPKKQEVKPCAEIEC